VDVFFGQRVELLTEASLFLGLPQLHFLLIFEVHLHMHPDLFLLMDRQVAFEKRSLVLKVFFPLKLLLD
jgi:hypothetical protein